MNRHFRSQVPLSCDGKLTRNRANSNFHPQPAIVILAPIWSTGEENSVTGTLKHGKSSVARSGGVVLRWSSGYGAGG